MCLNSKVWMTTNTVTRKSRKQNKVTSPDLQSLQDESITNQGDWSMHYSYKLKRNVLLKKGIFL